MKCQHAQKWMVTAAYGELDGGSAYELERHMADCPQC
ncbi:MAG: zf-HC2 domain-containing protein, partial [Terracidiphilus sp.]